MSALLCQWAFRLLGCGAHEFFGEIWVRLLQYGYLFYLQVEECATCFFYAPPDEVEGCMDGGAAQQGFVLLRQYEAFLFVCFVI